MKLLDELRVFSQKALDISRGTIARFQPYDLGRMAIEETPLVEIGIFRNNGETVMPCKIPHSVIVGVMQAMTAHMRALREKRCEKRNDSRRNILIEEEFHADMSLRSRSAANARHALMSSGVRSGKSFMISRSDIPEAR